MGDLRYEYKLITKDSLDRLEEEINELSLRENYALKSLKVVAGHGMFVSYLAVMRKMRVVHEKA